MSAYIRAMRILGGGLRGACNVNSSCDVRLTPLAAAMSPLRWRERRLRDLPGISLSQGANLAIDIHLTAQANITPFVACQKVTRFVVTEISTQLLADTPEPVVG